MAKEQGMEYEQGMKLKQILTFVVLVTGLIVVATQTTYVVNVGERGVLLTWGKANPTPVTEGLHFKMPFAQVVKKIEVRTQKYEADASAASSDLQIVSTKVATNFRIDPRETVQVYTTLGLSYADRVIQPTEQEVVKAITARFTAEELITQREQVRLAIKELLTQKLSERGITVEEVSITNFDFSKSFNEAIEAKVTAEQSALAARNKLEQIKFEAQQAIAAAEGQAQSIKIINEQLVKSPQYIDYLAVTKWNGQLPQATGSGAIPFINIQSKDGTVK